MTTDTVRMAGRTYTFTDEGARDAVVPGGARILGSLFNSRGKFAGTVAVCGGVWFLLGGPANVSSREVQRALSTLEL